MQPESTAIFVWIALMALAILFLFFTMKRKFRFLLPGPPVKTNYSTLPPLPPNWQRPPRICPKCGYDLRATPNRCPECGTVFTKEGTAQDTQATNGKGGHCP